MYMNLEWTPCCDMYMNLEWMPWCVEQILYASCTRSVSNKHLHWQPNWPKKEKRKKKKKKRPNAGVALSLLYYQFIILKIQKSKAVGLRVFCCRVVP